ncbi:hypothetical protein [Paracraurococcus ruber]|uniref:Uncharacterized protein n=1 Tax=Paracraurococcus ruber TaxID=77675 RepID=A0ABS1CYL0_9PROT|nr:hypothetical protein [Paracraurococcus ruber]MBK1659624.1 hypothetical protein [Paracraurococcus ruber]TDG29373.1 hypothetical protein E2C05_17960 [Paracraurococcus ruber]
MRISTSYVDQVVGTMVVPDMDRATDHRLEITSATLTGSGPSTLAIQVAERIVAPPARAEIVERVTDRAADGNGPVAVALGVINVFNPMAWLMSPGMTGVNPVTQTMQSANQQRTKTRMRFVRVLGSDAGGQVREFSAPAAGREILVVADTPAFVAELSYTLDGDGRLSLSLRELAAELTQLGYRPGEGDLELAIASVAPPTAAPARVQVPASLLGGAP